MQAPVIIRFMPLTCNIDAKGRRWRFIGGIALIVIGLFFAMLWTIWNQTVVPLILSAVCLLAGLFCIFQAKAGWCALRAMGFKTKV